MSRERRVLAAVAQALALYLLPIPSFAQTTQRPFDAPHAEQPPPHDPYVFVAGPKLGVEPSVRTIDSLGRLLFRYEEVLPFREVPEVGFANKALCVIGRSLKLFFLDEPIAELTALASHEVGGHGARGRELGYRSTFLFYLPGIYRLLFASEDGQEAGAYTTYLDAGPIEGTKNSMTTLGGLEANHVQAWWINARIASQQGWVHHGDLLTYLASKLSYANTFLSTSTERAGAPSSNDVNAYVTSLQELSNGWRAEARRRIARRLTAGYLWNLADPMLFYSVYGVAVSSLYRGERVSQVPLPRLGQWHIFPSPRFGLTPFGAEQGLDVFLSPREGATVLDLYARVGTSGLASYWGGGLRVLGSEIVSRHVPLGLELDVWRQPELLLDERGVFDRPSRMGTNVGLFADLRVFGGERRGDPRLGLAAKLAAKTPGFVPGQPLAGGPHGYVGLSVYW